MFITIALNKHGCYEIFGEGHCSNSNNTPYATANTFSNALKIIETRWERKGPAIPAQDRPSNWWNVEVQTKPMSHK